MSQPRHTHHSLLTHYLLTPSSLPTIVSYKEFLALHKPSSSSSTSTNPSTAHALKRLYQDLQFQRNLDIDTVRLNIDRQCTKGGILKAKLRRKLRNELGDSNGIGSRKRKHDDEDEDDKGNHDSVDSSSKEERKYDPLLDTREAIIDSAFFGPTGSVLPSTSTRNKYHTTSSLLGAMQHSTHDLELEIRELSKESEKVMEQMQETVGGLSDLRYGKFARVSASSGSGGGGGGGGGGGEVGDGSDGSVEGEVVMALRELTNLTNRKVRGKGRGETGS